MATSDDSKTEPKKATPAKAATPKSDAGAELAAAHEQRVSVPGADNVDARLDNRTGTDRPPLETYPAKPQQVDGPDVIHQVEHTRRVLAEQAKDGADGVTRKGMFSPGPHGLSDESLREGETTFGTEGLTEAQAADGNPKAGN